MLIYHQAYDAYHCLFRMIAIVDHVHEIEVDKARILDFYLMFPAMASKIKMPYNYAYIKKIAKAYENVYHDPLSPASTFKDLQEIQTSAIKCLTATGLVEKEFYKKGVLKRTKLEIPNGLVTSLMAFINEKKDINEFILSTLSDFHLLGKEGLKDRTGLMEYRYDFN